ncbi:hypothetical protein HA402_006902 [Bradysia odoriphaga]|nr:hypothetical protein HA402_006902 [Bradysia odoriphaga]
MKELNSSLIYKLELERELRRSLRRMIFWCKFFGVAPINLNFQTDAHQNLSFFKILLLNCRFVLHVLWSLLILTAIAISIHYERSFDERDTSSFILKCLYMGEYLFNISNCLLIVIGCHYQRRVYIKYFNRIIDIDMEFRECGVTTNYSQLNGYVKKFWYCSALFMVLATISDLMYYFNLNDFIRSATIFILSNLLTIVTFIAYFGLLYVLKERYKIIQSLLLQLVHQNEELSTRKPVEHYTLAVFDVMNIKKSAYRVPTLTMIQQINRLRKIYYDLAMFNEDINSSFGMLIISTTMSSFIVVSTQLYAFYDIARSRDGISDIYLAIYSGLWFIFNSVKVLLILLLNHHVCVERLRSRGATSREFLIFQKSLVTSALYSFKFNKEYRKLQASLYKFSLQIFHLKRYQDMTGILNLDLTLLTTIIGSLTTYFVILVQFGDYDHLSY